MSQTSVVSLNPDKGKISIECFQNHSNQLFLGIQKLKSEIKLCDVTLISNIDGKRVPASRLVLSASSEYFAKMFTGSLRESTESEVVLHEVTGDVLERLVEACYTGSLEICENSAEALLKAACLLQISTAITICCDYIKKQLEPSNCLGIALLTEHLNLTDMTVFVTDYVCLHFMEVWKCDEFLQLSTNQLFELLNRDDLNAQSEQEVMNALLAWLKHDRQNRLKQIPFLLKAIKLSLLPMQCLKIVSEAVCMQLIPCSQSLKSRKATNRIISVSNRSTLRMELFNPNTNEWSQLHGLYDHPKCDKIMGIEIIDRKMYLIDYSNGLVIFQYLDLLSMAWNYLWTFHISLKNTSTAFANGYAYIVGDNKEVECVDLLGRDDYIRKKITPMMVARKYPGLAVFDGILYVMGGFYDNNDNDVYVHHRLRFMDHESISSVEKYDPTKNKWAQCAPMITSRSNFGTGVLDDYIYVMGGQCSEYFIATNLVERYDVKNNTWSAVASLVRPCYNIGVAVLNSTLIVVGGADGYINMDFYKKDVQYYDQKKNEWKNLTPNKFSCSRCCAAIVSNDYISR